MYGEVKSTEINSLIAFLAKLLDANSTTPVPLDRPLG